MFLVCIFLIVNSILLLVHKLGFPPYHKWFFAFAYSRLFGPGMAAAMDKRKSILLAPLWTLTSKDKDLAERGGLRLLEIGSGPGLNWKFFRQGTQVITVDTNDYFTKYLQHNLETFPYVKLEKHLICSAENMYDVADNSVDVVLSTYVLCSVTDPQKVAKEVLRVLAPGGHFFYLEHCGYQPGSWGRSLQRFLQPVWTAASDGCHLTRNISNSIRETGFLTIKEEQMSIDCVPFVMRPHTIGTAIK